MRLTFVKMHASGNDFIIIDNRLGQIEGDVPEMVRRLCRPHFSVGADGLILIENSDAADFKWRFFNSNGSEAEMCGNGSRCAALFAYMKCIGGRKLGFETRAGIIRAEIKDGSVKVGLTPPMDYRPEIAVNIGGKDFKAASINTGVPHVVYFVDEVESADVLGIGAATRYHKLFAPGGTNANFAQVAGRNELILRTYERGVETETMACGTGATASALVAGAAGFVDSPVRVKTRGGSDLMIYFDWDGKKFGDVFLEGDAVFVYQGRSEEGALL
ncbi:MAG: diaminopimelate epimerase [Nitrospirota bacterium]